VKSNNDDRLLKWLHQEGARFDCASPKEIQQALSAGANPRHILYANPCKSLTDVKTAKQLGISTTVVDSPEEVQKLLEAGYRGSTLIRLKVPDAASAMPFSRKFGAPLSWLPDIFYALKGQDKIRHIGWSFHVGSICNDPNQYRTAIEMCAEASSQSQTQASVVDIGGGFIPDPEKFAAAAAAIRDSQALFPDTTKWIAEPGRFFSSSVATLYVTVIGTKGGKIYTINDSVYGSFSNIPFDGQRPTYRLIAANADQRPRVRATLFGHTCDSADCLAEDIDLPELRVGDLLEVPNMGAYTLVSASMFNGFPLAERHYHLA
jgi:diaminopimelate decarboxylase